MCQACRQNYIKQHIPALNSIHPSSPPPSTPPRPAPVNPSPGPLSPEEIRKKISSLQPLKVISSPATNGQQKFFVLQPNSEGRVETVVFEDTVTEREREEVVRRAKSQARVGIVDQGRAESPASDSGSITVKEERIGGDEDPVRGKEVEEAPLSTRTPSPGTLVIGSPAHPASCSPTPPPASPLQAPALVEPKTPEDDSNKPENSGKSRKKKEVSSNNDEYKFFCKLCHIGFLKETSYKYHFANNVELHRKMKRTTEKVKTTYL